MAEIKDGKGRFAPGNPGGKLKHPVSAKNRAIAEVCRELWERYGTKTAEEIFSARQNWSVKERLLEFIVERGFGKAPLTVKLGSAIDPDSPEGILLRLAGQTVPGLDGQTPPGAANEPDGGNSQS